jgi:serine/threonine-protein kinase
MDWNLDRSIRIADTVDQSPLGNGSEHQAPRVKLIGEGRPKLATEIQTVLRQRLRNALLLLVSAEVVFLIRQIIFEKFDAGWFRFMISIQLLVAIIIAALTALIFSQKPLSLEQLRRLEVSVFALIGLVLVLVQHLGVVKNAADAPEWAVFNLMLSVVFWFGLMSVYGMFIPNTWQRAARVTSVMALSPICVLLIDYYGSEAVAAVIPANALITLTLLLIFGAASATYGTYTIGTLRQEAFAARQLGQYRLRQLLGSGGMGEVYLAEHLLLKRRCAIKMIRPGIATDPKVLARFEREVRATAELTHWNTVEIYDYGRADDGTFYYVMEFLPGLNLAEIVDRYGPLPPDRTIHFLRQICAALREAHLVDLIHRDIKPANVFVAKLGGLHDVIKLLDFGLVAPRRQEIGPQISQEGQLTGSPLYMAPEQAVGNREPDARSDIYALGAVAYFALTGKPPFEGTNALDVLVRHARDPVTPLHQRRPGLPADLERIVLRCLAKEADDRFTCVEELDHALASCQAAASWTEDRAAKWWREISTHGEELDISHQLAEH